MSLLESLSCLAPSDLSFDFPLLPTESDGPAKIPFDFLFGENTEANVMVIGSLGADFVSVLP
jgi:hypothetical protein